MKIIKELIKEEKKKRKLKEDSHCIEEDGCDL